MHHLSIRSSENEKPFFHYSIIPKPNIPIFQHSIIPINCERSELTSQVGFLNQVDHAGIFGMTGFLGGDFPPDGAPQ
jgi:hypothetical protein